MSEADLHFDLYSHLKSSIEDGVETRKIPYGSVKPEVRVNGGRADLVVYDDRERPVFVIEAKREGGSGARRDIDPYSPKVVKQAFDYAGRLGADYFATYNGRHCVVYETFQAGKPLLDRRTRAYKIESPKSFAAALLKEIDGLAAGSVDWDPHHRAFTNRLRVYHQRLSSSFGEQIPEKVEEDESFEDDLEQWAGEQGWEDDPEEEVYRRYAMQAAYLLMNKLLFYKLLEDTGAYDVPIISMRDLIEPEKRREVFDNLIEELDFEAVYEHDKIFDALPLSGTTRLETKELLDQLEDFDLSRFDHDVIGQIYQEIIPPEERHNLGQYYTPPEVVDLICRLTINDGDDMVLDPGCGSGGFLVGAYQRLAKLKGNPSHQELLDQLKGFDINRFPAHLSAINLALQDLEEETRDVGVEVENFFLANPTQVRMAFGSASVGGNGETGSNVIEAFDAVVGNPPYIRQEQIADKDRCRRHLGDVGADLGSRSDIYAYFFTHATSFLGESGRLGFITSDRWLSVKYGEALQDFFLEKYKIKAIVNFARQQFEIPLISTCVVILERCVDATGRDENVVKMLQLKKASDVEDIVEELQEEREANQIDEEEDYRLVTMKQEGLKHEDKWGRFLWAPSVYWTVMKEVSLVPLGDLGKMSRGLTTGANKFFYFKKDQEWKEWGIDSKFIRPLLKHHAEMDFTSLREGELTWSVLDVNWFVEKHFDDSADSEDAKTALEEEGYLNLKSYIEWGENEENEFDQRSSIQQRDVWFNLGELEAPPLGLIEVYWRDLRTIYNEAGAIFDKRQYCLWTDESVDEKVLAGVLNSRLYGLMRELHGRIDQGEGMNRNSLMVYEAKNLPVPDPRSMEDSEKEEIKDAFETLIEAERSAAMDTEEAEDELDRAVMSAIEMVDRTEDIQEATRLLLRVREEGAGEMTDVLVESGEELETSLKGARRVEGNKGQIELSL
jgi:type I restriction-modification system DNA methylase subunit